jgi:hypothetical protein
MVLENFLTYTEVDPDDLITVTNRRVTQTARQNKTGYVYKTFGDDHFGDFEHLFEMRMTDNANDGLKAYWMLSDDLGDMWALHGANKPYLSISGFDDVYYLRITEFDGTNYYVDTYDALQNTTYYLTVTKIGTAFTAKVYSDADRTNLLATINPGVLQSDYKFKYLYPANTSNYNNAVRYATGWTQNLDLQECLNPLIGKPFISPDIIKKAKIRF